MKRYSIDTTEHAGITISPDGEFVKYEDLTRLLDFIQKGKDGISPKAAVINGIFDFFADEQDSK